MNTIDPPKKKRTKRDDIYDFAINFADDHSGSSLTPHGIWMLMCRQRRDFTMKWSTFRTHWLLLLNEGRVEIRDGVVVIVGSEWHPPDPEILRSSSELSSQY